MSGVSSCGIPSDIVDRQTYDQTPQSINLKETETSVILLDLSANKTQPSETFPQPSNRYPKSGAKAFDEALWSACPFDDDIPPDSDWDSDDDSADDEPVSANVLSKLDPSTYNCLFKIYCDILQSPTEIPSHPAFSDFEVEIDAFRQDGVDTIVDANFINESAKIQGQKRKCVGALDDGNVNDSDSDHDLEDIQNDRKRRKTWKWELLKEASFFHFWLADIGMQKREAVMGEGPFYIWDSNFSGAIIGLNFLGHPSEHPMLRSFPACARSISFKALKVSLKSCNLANPMSSFRTAADQDATQALTPDRDSSTGTDKSQEHKWNNVDASVELMMNYLRDTKDE